MAAKNYSFQNTQNQTSVIYLDNGSRLCNIPVRFRVLSSFCSFSNVSTDFLNEWTFSDSPGDNGQPGSLTRQKYLAHASSSLSAYWPNLIYQGVTGEIRQVSYACVGKNQCYYDKALSTTQARHGTQLLILPKTTNLSTIAVYYQEQDGRFLEYEEDNTTGVTTVLQNRELHPNELRFNGNLEAYNVFDQQRRFQTSYHSMRPSPASPRSVRVILKT